MVQYAQNDARSTLDSNLTPSSTILVLTPGTGTRFGDDFPQKAKLIKRDANELEIQKEIISITGRTGDTLQITRAVETITESYDANVQTQNALQFDSGDEIVGVFTAQDYEDLQAGSATVETNVTAYVDSEIADVKSEIQQQAYVYASSSTGTDAYAITVTPTPTIVAGSSFTFRADVENTGGATLDVNGTSASILKKNDQPLEDGDIEVGQEVKVQYDGTNWQMISQVASVINIEVSNLQSEIGLAGESIGAGDALRFGVLYSETETILATTNPDDIMGQIGRETTLNGYGRGQGFNAPKKGIITNISLFFSRVGNPDGNVKIEVYSDETFTTLLGTSDDVLESTISTTAEQVDFSFSTPVAVDNLDYAYKVYSDGTIDISNYLNAWGEDDTDEYIGYGHYAYPQSGSPTLQANHDMWTRINIESPEDTSKLYKTDSQISDDVIAFSTSSYAIDDTVKAYTDGVVGGYTGFTAGEPVYLDTSTPGAISTTGTVKVGKAMSATSFLIEERNKVFATQVSFSSINGSSGDVIIPHNLGRKPTYARYHRIGYTDVIWDGEILSNGLSYIHIEAGSYDKEVTPVLTSTDITFQFGGSTGTTTDFTLIIELR